jgi:hypothetical protein
LNALTNGRELKDLPDLLTLLSVVLSSLFIAWWLCIVENGNEA